MVMYCAAATTQNGIVDRDEPYIVIKILNNFTKISNLLGNHLSGILAHKYKHQKCKEIYTYNQKQKLKVGKY